MEKSSISLIMTILAIIWASCNNQTKKMDTILIKEENHSINLYFNGLTRLRGINPVLENLNSDYPEIKLSDNDISYSGNGQKIIVKYESKNGVIIFSLSSAMKELMKGSDFIGLFIDSFPDYSIGTSFYKYGSVKTWTHPMLIKRIRDMTAADNQFFLWKYEDGLYGAAIPLGGNGYMAQLGKNNEAFGAKSYSLMDGTEAQNVPVTAIAFGSDPYKTIENVYREGLKFMDKASSLRENKTYPAFFNRLIWCTWNSFGHQLSEKNIFSAMDEFKKAGIHIPLVLLDDGWSTVTKYGTGKLQSFEPDKVKFPNGLKPIVNRLKSEFGVEEVGVWHAFNGYWAGIDRNSDLGEKYKNDLLSYQDKVAWSDEPIDTFYFVNPMSKAGFQFYDDWYSYLKSEGISFVKVDNQLIANRLAEHNYPFSTLAEAMQNNLQAAIKKHFDGNVLNCMDMTTDAVYNFGSSPIGRASEDYFPENDSYHIEAGNAAVHITCNVYNSLWWSQMVWPDFDMFQTHHPNAEYHAIARAISGGPIYIADSVGLSNPEILKKLILEDGSILKSDQPAVPTEDCLFSLHDHKPLKVFSVSNKTGLLAIFNVADTNMVEGFFTPKDIHGFEARNYAIYDYMNKKAFRSEQKTQFPVRLDRLTSQLYYIKALQYDFASFGLIEKYNAPKTIKKEIIQDKLVLIELYESGTFVAFTEKTPLKIVTTNDIPLQYTFEKGLLLIKLPKGVTQIGIQF